MSANRAWAFMAALAAGVGGCAPGPAIQPPPATTVGAESIAGSAYDGTFRGPMSIVVARSSACAPDRERRLSIRDGQVRFAWGTLGQVTAAVEPDGRFRGGLAAIVMTGHVTATGVDVEFRTFSCLFHFEGRRV